MGNISSNSTNGVLDRFSESSKNSENSGPLVQIIFGLFLGLVLYVVLIFIEIIYKYYNRLTMNKTTLLADTYTTDDKTQVISQNPANGGFNKSLYINVSDNERTGIEFSYSFYLNVNPSTFRQELGLLHIFHKGYAQQFPLLAPGVYMRSDTNTLRVYMNTYKTWNNYLEVENIPIGKWVHVVVSCKENSLEIFINGNISRKMSFDGFAPYQNNQDLICFSQRRITYNHTIIPSTDETGFNVYGQMKGFISRLNYFSYALGYAEIQSLMDEGPSSKYGSLSASPEIPPYLDDTWWSKGY